VSITEDFAAINAAMQPVVPSPPVEQDDTAFNIDRELNERYLVAIEASVDARLLHLLDIERAGPKAIELELAICADPQEGFLYWLKWYGWTYDPRNLLEKPPLPAHLPFDLCERQVDLYRWIEYILSVRQDGAVKKSRGVGFTWETGAFAWWKWRFAPGFKTTFASRKSTEVDQIGNPDSIFERIRMIYRKVPKWMLPKEFNPFLHDKQNLLINPENGNTIRGEGGDEIGRGGRSTLVILDEASRLEHADQVEAATSATSDARIWGSSINPRNENNYFARKYNSLPPKRVFRFHYSEHPIWTPGKIARKKSDMSEETWAAEFEIDDSYTVEDICIPAAWVKSATKLPGLLHERYTRLVAEGKLSEALPFRLQPSIEGKAGGDVGGGKAASVIIARFGPVICRPKAWGDPDTTDTALKMLDYCAETKLAPRDDNYVPRIRYLRYDSVAIGQGVASTMKRNPRAGLIVTGVNTGNPASNVKWPDGEYAHEKFFNTKAEGWWTSRERFKKTNEMVLWLLNQLEPNEAKRVGGAKQHPVDELAALPDDPKDVHLQKLISQLSQVKWWRRENGKIIMESKEALAKRGISSPDYADAYVLTETGMGKAEKLAAFSKVVV
jgi:phage terminase large subunit